MNGDETTIARDETVAGVVTRLVPGGGRGVAVARNGEVVPRSQWATTALCDGDRLEVLTAAQGG